MKERICFIGAGNMASAILGGLIKQGIPSEQLSACCPAEDQLKTLHEDLGIQVSTDNNAMAQQADVIVLAVKPQVLQSVCEALSASLAHKPLIISIAAGTEMASLDKWLGNALPIVRCMPNTPAQILKGASGLVANERVTEQQKEAAYTLFSAVGVVDWIETEDQMHAITALSGSGPAYIFMVIESMEAAATKLGINPSVARKLAAQTVAGAAEMVLSSELEPAQLKRNVMSPGGTTERAIHTFEEGGLLALFEKAIQAASDRSEELAAMAKN